MLMTILFMMVIGAIIGGITNELAIKMLFRPYKAIYVGKWRVPFTPGIIPKRRGELSKQLGDMVVKYLLTSEGVKGKLEEESFKNNMIEWAKVEATKKLKSEITIKEFVQKYIKVDNLEEKVKIFISKNIKMTLLSVIEKNETKKIKELLPEHIDEKVSEKIPTISYQITKRAIEYLESYEGERKLEIMVNHLLEEKRVLKGFVSMFVGNEKVVDKAREEMIKVLSQSTTQESLQGLLWREWEKIKTVQIGTFITHIGKEEIMKKVDEKIVENIPINNWLNKTIKEISEPYQEIIIENYIPKSIEVLRNGIVNKVDELMTRFDISNIVKKQVENFPVERLEDIILSISKKEFKMITYLGAALGGLIGLIQALIFFAIN